ncbi:AAA family ATPase [Fontibacillus sp. BL9]|uniref:AAA family ATPase n=1 Tax=Fontibacillus sp. BL9 TaxID=3389971 RepID=UPI0039780ED3
MRLEKLQVSGFGHLHGLQMELEGPVTVLYGPNEVGKSTLLGFVRAMLFGIPSRTYGPQRYEPVGGGSHGGSLAIQGDDGTKWLIERYAQPPEGISSSGAKVDRLRITRTGEDGQLYQLSQQDLERELLGGMSKEMFRQLFAVSLNELQEVSALQSEEMSRFLFHAGIGGGAAVLRGEKKLLQDMDKLYRPRGRNQEIAQLLQGLERLERQTGAAKSLLPRYQEVVKELEEANAGLAAGESELTVRGRENSRLRKAVERRPDWLRLEALRVELERLPERSPFPEQGLARWQTLQEEKERLRLEAAELTRRIAALQAELESAAPKQAVLEREGGVRALAGRLPSYESGFQELAGLRAEAEQMEGKLAQALRSIHPGWTAGVLRSFAGTVGERETVRQFMGRFHAYDKDMDLLYNERFKLEREAAALESSFIQAKERLDESAVDGRRQFTGLVPQDRSEIRRLWQEISVLLDRWRAASASRLEGQRAAESEAAARTRIRSLYQKLLGGTAVLTILLPAVLWLTAKSGWGALLTGILLLCFDGYLALELFSGSRKKRDPRRRSFTGSAGWSASTATPEENGLRELLPQLIGHAQTAAGISSPGGPSFAFEPERWDEEERTLRRLMEQWQLWDQRHEGLEAQARECRFKAAGKAEELEGLERELSRKETIFNEMAREWENWLQERHLPGDLSPEAAMDVFRLAEQGKDWLSRLDALYARISALQVETADFERDWREQIGDADESEAVTQGTSVAGAFRKALAELELQLGLKIRQERIVDKRTPLEEELGRNQDRLAAVQAAEHHLLEESGASDGETYLRYGAEAETRERLQSDIRQAELVLFGSLNEEQIHEFEKLLRGLDEESLLRSAEEAKRKLEEAELGRQQLQERRGRLLQEQESLEARGLQDHMQQQLAEQQAALEGTLDRYAVMAVCHELISRVRKIYEEERQPEVLQAASGYLAEMTGGTYRRILMKMGSQELMAEHRDHGPIGSAYLSRGTAEQLYLSMRLALSGAVSGRANMPILLDDLFVNFDAGRLAGAMSVLKNVADKHQLIMMTCHAHVIEGVKSVFPEAQIIAMA